MDAVNTLRNETSAVAAIQLGRPPQPGLMLASISLCRREIVRFLRQRNRIIGALLTPVVFWLMIGGGMGDSFKAEGMPGGASYMQYFFPGVLVMILLFTAIFSTISIIEDRREGFLQSVLVAPVSRMAIVLGKVLGGTLLAFGQGIIFLLLAPTVGIHLTAAAVGVSIVVMLIVSFALTALGFCIAWRMSSTQGFHAIMNLFLLPMWLLSGALFPGTGSHWNAFTWIMAVNPLSYGLAALRRAMHPGQVFTGSFLPGMTVGLTVSIGFAVVMFFLASMLVKTRVAADLQ